MFTVIMFFKVPILREAANLFKAISLSVKRVVLPFNGARSSPEIEMMISYPAASRPFPKGKG
jgi:hypothetical protein